MNLTLGDISISIRSGALVSALLMLPNLVWMLLPKADAGEQTAAPLALTIAEHVGRAAVLIVPFFLSLDLNRECATAALLGMGLALALYYASWIRYFAGGRSAHLFGAPLLGIPLPMVVAPTLFLVLSSYLMGSWCMLAATVVFGVAHIWVSALSL